QRHPNMTAPAMELIRNDRDFTNNDIKAALDNAERELRDYAAPIANMKADALSHQLAAETNGAADVLDGVKAVVERMKKLGIAVAARGDIDWKDKDAALAA